MIKRIPQTFANNPELARVVDFINNNILNDVQTMQDVFFDPDDMLVDSGGNVMTGSDGNVMFK